MNDILKIVLAIFGVYVVSGMLQKDTKSIQQYYTRTATTSGDMPLNVKQRYNDVRDTKTHMGPETIIYTAPGCVHCEMAMPEFEKAVKKLKKQGHHIRISKKPDEALATGKVEGFPTIMHKTSSGELKEYSGPRKSDHISNWVSTM